LGLLAGGSNPKVLGGVDLSATLPCRDRIARSSFFAWSRIDSDDGAISRLRAGIGRCGQCQPRIVRKPKLGWEHYEKANLLLRQDRNQGNFRGSCWLIVAGKQL